MKIQNVRKVQNTEKAMAPDEARRALATVLASEAFVASPQLAAFLRYVVEASLRGESDRIKGYTIGVEALGRDPSFDPQIDPIVRVEATRLRRTLDRYYTGPGAADPIVFALSRGSYVPAIRRRAEGETQTTIDLWKRLPQSRAWLAAFAASVLVVAIVIVAFAMRGREAHAPDDVAVASAQSFDGPLQPGNGMPTLAIPRVTLMPPAPSLATPRSQVNFAKPITDKLRSAFARFDTLNVVGDPDEPGAPPAAKAEPDYQLIGSGEFQEDGTLNGRARLLDVRAGTIIWSHDFGPFPAAMTYGPAEDSIVQQIATTLAPPFGVIRANERRKHLATGAGDPRYRCVVEASESFRSFDPVQHTRARTCLERLTARDPSFAMGFAYLASVYTREFQYGLGAATDAAVLDDALRAARQAIELNPESARAYQMLFTVLFARREMPAAFAAGDKALALNPYDMTILSDYGGRLIMTGEVDRGLEAITRAADESALRASWYQFYLFLGAYLKNDIVVASRHAGQIGGTANPLGPLARSLSAAAEGNRDRARKAFDELVALRPAWRTGARDELRRMFPERSVSDRLADDLVKAGLVSG